MADIIVQPKVLSSQNPDTYDNLIMAQAQNATYATYASTDTSKGTIEERLTALGFKQGSVAMEDVYIQLTTEPPVEKQTSPNMTQNLITKQGTYVIVNLQFESNASKGAQAFILPPNQTSLLIGTIPQEFCPIQNLSENISVATTTLGINFTSNLNINTPAILNVNTNGEIQIEFLQTYGSYLYFANIIINFGYNQSESQS